METGSRFTGLPWPEAIGVATGLTVGFAVAFVLLGPVVTSAAVFMRIGAVVLFAAVGGVTVLRY